MSARTQVGGGEYTFEWNALEGNTLSLEIRSGVCTNIRCVHEDDIGTYASAPFRSQFLDYVSSVTNGPIRVRDWMKSITSGIVNWADRPTATGFFGASTGVRPEVVVDMVEALGRDIFVSIPYAASDDYVTQLATYIEANLTGDCWVEYGSEVFRTGGRLQRAVCLRAECRRDRGLHGHRLRDCDAPVRGTQQGSLHVVRDGIWWLVSPQAGAVGPCRRRRGCRVHHRLRERLPVCGLHGVGSHHAGAGAGLGRHGGAGHRSPRRGHRQQPAGTDGGQHGRCAPVRIAAHRLPGRHRADRCADGRVQRGTDGRGHAVRHVEVSRHPQRGRRHRRLDAGGHAEPRRRPTRSATLLRRRQHAEGGCGCRLDWRPDHPNGFNHHRNIGLHGPGTHYERDSTGRRNGQLERDHGDGHEHQHVQVLGPPEGGEELDVWLGPVVAQPGRAAFRLE